MEDSLKLISDVSKEVGLSRTALLYYEKLKIITCKRSSNGYRVYSKKGVQRIKLLQLLTAGGLTLNECKACLETKIDRELLEGRLRDLDEEIKEKQISIRMNVTEVKFFIGRSFFKINA